MLVALGNLGPAKRSKRPIHGTRLVPVFPVANAHLALIRPLLQRGEFAEKAALAFLLDGGSQLNVTAGAERAFLEDLHPAVASGGRVDHLNDFAGGHRGVETDRGECGTGDERQNDGQNGRTGSKKHRVLLPELTLSKSTSRTSSK